MIQPSAKYYCTRCGEPLKTGKGVWLELNEKTDQFVDPAKVRVPPEDSQGGFIFGADCARAVLAGANPYHCDRKGKQS